MTLSGFQKRLRQGHGRAVAFVRTQSPATYRDALLDACLHNLAYDRQCEEVRGQYLAALVELSGEPEFYRGQVLSALASAAGDPEPDDVLQMFAVASNWEEARGTLYEAFARGVNMDCDQYLVLMDGAEGLAYAVRSFDRIDEGDRDQQFGLLVSALEERDGKEAAAESMAGRPELRDLLGVRRAHDERLAQQEASCDAEPRRDYDSVKRSILGLESWVSFLNWGKNAGVEELQRAASDLNAESDEKRLFDYLMIFRKARFPGPTGRLIELARHGDGRLSRAAVHALKRREDPDLRALSLELMGTADRCDAGVTLLASRGGAGDYPLLEDLLRKPMSEFHYHCLGTSVLDFVKANPAVEAAGTLALLYEDGPCSMCRERSVRYWIKIDRLPESIREECRYDADSGTRDFAG